MLAPSVYNRKELKLTPLTEECITKAALLLNSALGDSFFDKLEQRFLDQKNQHNISKHLSLHPLHSWLRSANIDDMIWLVSFVNSLEVFGNQPAIKEYLQRLKKTKSALPAVFELMVARKFSMLEFEVELEKLKPNGNPIESLLTHKKSKTLFWVECKAEGFETTEETLEAELLRKLMPQIKKLKKNSALHLKLERPIKNREELKKILECVNNIFRKKDIKSMTRFNFSFVEMFIFLFKPGAGREIANGFVKKSALIIAMGGTTEHDSSYLGLPKNYEEVEMEYVIAIEYPFEKKEEKSDYEKTVKALKEKIKQHEDLLEANEEVIIVLEWKLGRNIENELKKYLEERKENFPNLTVLLTHMSPNKQIGDVEVIFYPLLLSEKYLIANEDDI